MQETDDAKERADLIMTNVIPLGHRFYPSESSFPLRSWFDLFSRRLSKLSFLPGFIATLLVRFTLANKSTLTPGWAARVLIQCGIRFAEIWDVFHEMYESQVINFDSSFFLDDLNEILGTTLQWSRKRSSGVIRNRCAYNRLDCRVHPAASQHFTSRIPSCSSWFGMRSISVWTRAQPDWDESFVRECQTSVKKILVASHRIYGLSIPLL